LGDDKNASLLKFLLRCQKMLDAKNEVLKILQMIFLSQIKSY